MRSLADIVISGAGVFRSKAEKASSTAERDSLLRCASASIRLGEKLRLLQLNHNGLPLFREIEEQPEHQLMIRERIFRGGHHYGE